MPTPYSLLPLALAAHNGSVDGYETQQLVAAGLTLLQRSAPLVRSLSGKRAAILLPTSAEFFVALAACEGRAAVLINPLASASEISYQLADARVGAVFTTGALATRLPDGIPQVWLDSGARNARVLVDGVARDIDLGSHHGLSIEGDTDVPGSDDDAAIVYTSAMAGTPLGAVLTHRNLLANARSTSSAVDNSSHDRVLALLPFSHLFGLTVTASAPLLSGASVVTMPRFHPERAVELIAGGGITEVVGVPAVFRSLLSAIEHNGRAKFGALRMCICGGAPLSVALQDRWHEVTGIELRQGYGLTEAGPVCLFNAADRPNARGALGDPLPNVEIQLRTPTQYDDRGVAMASDDFDDTPRDQGEICVRGENVFRGYVNGDTTGLPVRNGWLYTGDVGERRPDGAIAFVRPIKPMFTRNGFNIYPREIERVVGEMPGVERVSVRELPHPDGGSTIGIDVRGAATSDDVRRWCAGQLSAYKQPAVITIL
jgi:long-chain acyl-CoA synthetase